MKNSPIRKVLSRAQSETDQTGEPYAEILAVGTELVWGGRAESNSLFLSRELGEAGIPVRRKVVVCDEQEEIIHALTDAAQQSQVVVVTGGLGPTFDDLTREAVAKTVGVPLRQRTPALRMIQSQLALRGRSLAPMQRRQARLPVGAFLLPNSVGTAPGFYLFWKKCLIVVLPGVPHEARVMFERQVLPLLHARFGSRQALKRWVFQTFGLAESEVQKAIQPWLRHYPDVQVGLSATPLGVSVMGYQRVRSSSRRTITPIDRQFDSFAARVKKILGSFVYSEGEEVMEQVVGWALADHGLRIATAESCTGGLIGHRLTQVPGSSRYLDRGVVCYSNQAKIDWLGVPGRLLAKHGAVSAPVAKAMAHGIRIRAGTDMGLSVTGIAGPDGGTKAKPVGLVFIGLDTKKGHVTQKYHFHDDRNGVKLRASQAALNMVRLWLAKQAG